MAVFRQRFANGHIVLMRELCIPAFGTYQRHQSCHRRASPQQYCASGIGSCCFADGLTGYVASMSSAVAVATVLSPIATASGRHEIRTARTTYRTCVTSICSFSVNVLREYNVSPWDFSQCPVSACAQDGDVKEVPLGDRQAFEMNE